MIGKPYERRTAQNWAVVQKQDRELFDRYMADELTWEEYSAEIAARFKDYVRWTVRRFVDRHGIQPAETWEDDLMSPAHIILTVCINHPDRLPKKLRRYGYDPLKAGEKTLRGWVRQQIEWNLRDYMDWFTKADLDPRKVGILPDLFHGRHTRVKRHSEDSWAGDLKSKDTAPNTSSKLVEANLAGLGDPEDDLQDWVVETLAVWIVGEKYLDDPEETRKRWMLRQVENALYGERVSRLERRILRFKLSNNADGLPYTWRDLAEKFRLRDKRQARTILENVVRKVRKTLVEEAMNRGDMELVGAIMEAGMGGKSSHPRR